MSAELDFAEPGSKYHFDPDPVSGGIRSLIRVVDNQFISPYELWKLALRSNPMLLREVSWSTKSTYAVQTELPAQMLQVQTTDGPKFIKSMTFEAECWHEVQPGSLSEGKYYDYAGPDGTIVQRAEFNTNVNNVPFVCRSSSVCRSRRRRGHFV